VCGTTIKGVNSGIPSLTMGFRLSISTTMAYWKCLIEMSHLGSWLHITCHLSAQYGFVDSLKDYGLVVNTLVYYPEERVCLLASAQKLGHPTHG
jgi:hypothetical protein